MYFMTYQNDTPSYLGGRYKIHRISTEKAIKTPERQRDSRIDCSTVCFLNMYNRLWTFGKKVKKGTLQADWDNVPLVEGNRK